MAKADYYEVLGISRSATKDEIKKAYRKMAIKYHPDKNQGDPGAEAKFKEAAEAYEVLGDDEKRSRYDRFGHSGVGGNGGFSGAGGMSMDDIFSQFGDIFGEGNPFESFFGGSARSGGGRRKVFKGSNLRIKVKLNLQEVANGVEKKLKLKKHITCDVCGGTGAKDRNSFMTCPTCNGSGQVRQVTNTFLGQMYTTSTCPNCKGEGRIITSKCTHCHGEGRVQGEDIVTVNIPPGARDGVQLSVTGKGNAAPKGGISGDLIIVIEEEEHPDLKRDGNNVMFDLYLGFSDAALGTNVEIPTIDGKVKIDVPAGTQGGKIFRLKHKGVPDLNTGRKGDELIHVNIWVPKKLSDKEKELLGKIRHADNFQPKPDEQDKTFFDKVKEIFS